MGAIFDTYQFQFTLTGIINADSIDMSGLIMGYKIGLISTAFDFTTNFIEEAIPLEIVTQIDPDEPIS